MKADKNDVMIKATFLIVCLCISLGFGLLFKKINHTQNQLSQIINEQNRLTSLLENKMPDYVTGTYKKARIFTATPETSDIQADVLAAEISRKLKNEIRSLADTLGHSATNSDQNQVADEEYDGEESEDYLKCMSFVDSIYEHGSMTDQEILALSKHKQNLSPIERHRVNTEIIRMLNNGEIELENPGMFFAQGLH